MELSEKLKLIRTDKGLTQRAMAEQIGIIMETYRKYETGVRLPGKKSLEKIASSLNVSVGYLLGETDNSKEQELINLFRALSEPHQKQVLSYTNSLVNEEKAPHE